MIAAASQAWTDAVGGGVGQVGSRRGVSTGVRVSNFLPLGPFARVDDVGYGMHFLCW